MSGVNFSGAKGVPKNRLRDVFDKYSEVERTIDVPALLLELGVDVDMSGDDEWIGHCPLPSHKGADRNPSFSVNPSNFSVNCFACLGGSMLTLVKEMRQCDWDDALSWLMQFTDYGADGERFVDIIDAILDEPQSHFRSRNPELPWYPKRQVEGLHYGQAVADRSISEQAASELGIGIRDIYRKRAYEGPAIVIPHYFEGHLVGWQARLVGNIPEGQPRHDNTADLPKSLTLYGWDLTLVSGGVTFVVESPLTVARLRSAGYSAVATFGASISKEQLRLMRRLGRLALAFDNDDAGLKATEKVLEALHPFAEQMYWVPPVPGEKADLGDILDDDALDSHIAKAEAL